MGILVSAGVQQSISAQYVSFAFQNLPVGPQRATLLAADGSLMPAQQTATISAGQTAPIDVVSADPNAVHLTFLVQLPADTEPAAVLRLAGDLTQAGDTLAPAANGATVAGASGPGVGAPG